MQLKKNMLPVYYEDLLKSNSTVWLLSSHDIHILYSNIDIQCVWKCFTEIFLNEILLGWSCGLKHCFSRHPYTNAPSWCLKSNATNPDVFLYFEIPWKDLCILIKTGTDYQSFSLKCNKWEAKFQWAQCYCCTFWAAPWWLDSNDIY